jgi:hypothetical protein
MSKDDPAQKLHDKSTRGEVLSAEEQVQLAQWYTRLDCEEQVVLGRGSPSPSVTTLQAQLDAALADLLTVSHRIQTLTAENETLRRDIAALQRQLAQKPTKQLV